LKFTFNSHANTAPVWTPDEKHIVYVSGDNTIWWIRADGRDVSAALFRRVESSRAV